MAILRNRSQTRQNYDPSYLSLGYDTGANGGYGGAMGLPLPPRRAGVRPNNEVSTYSNTTRFPAGYMQQEMARNDPMSTIFRNQQRFGAAPGIAAAVPGMAPGRELNYANINGSNVLLPPAIGAVPGQNVTGRLADFMKERAAQKMANRPDADTMEARRWDYRDRAAARKASLAEGRLARLAQQQRMSGQPVTPIAAEALQDAQLRLGATRGEHDRTQSGLNADTQASNLKKVGTAENDVAVDKAERMNPLDVQQAKDLGFAETEVQTRRLRDLALAGADTEVLNAEKARREAELQGQVAQAVALAQAQREEDMKKVMQDREIAQLPAITQQNIQTPQNADTGTMSNWLEDMSHRMTPEQFQQEMKTNQNISPSRLRDLYDEMQSIWFPNERQRNLRDWIGESLGVDANKAASSRRLRNYAASFMTANPIFTGQF